MEEMAGEKDVGRTLLLRMWKVRMHSRLLMFLIHAWLIFLWGLMFLLKLRWLRRMTMELEMNDYLSVGEVEEQI